MSNGTFASSTLIVLLAFGVVYYLVARHGGARNAAPPTMYQIQFYLIVTALAAIFTSGMWALSSYIKRRTISSVPLTVAPPTRPRDVFVGPK